MENMEDLYEMVIRFFTTYGWQLGIIALSGIVLLGVLKAFGVFNKIASTKRKYVYTAVSVALSLVGGAAYLGIVGNFDWKAFLVMVPLVYSVNQIAYNVYENTGVRAAFRAIFGKIVDRLKSSKDKRIEDSAAKAEANNTETATATPSTEQVAEVRTVKAKKAVQATAVNVEPVAKTKVSKKDI